LEIEPLLSQIDQLAPAFGRVSSDLSAIVSRGRAKDFKGVMQNTRLVLEALLRDLVTRELKQTPGKAMLDELITKFRQQTNAGIVPTNILAHMGTVQAWGNLSSHDHAGALTDAGVQVGEQEVAASLNSMVAILSWYAGRSGLDGTLVRPPTQAPAGKKNRTPMIVGLSAAAVLLVGGYLLASRGPATPGTPVAAEPFAALNALYRTRGEPLPPAACRSADEGSALAAAKDEGAFASLHSPEAAYLLARLKYEAGAVDTAGLQRASACPGFAAALSLSGKLAVREAEASQKGGEATQADELLGKAAREFDAAIAAEPNFKNARFNRAVVMLKRGHADDAARDLTELVAQDPEFTEAHFFLALALEKQGDKVRAKGEYCAAARQGYKLAASRCEAEP
jgi:hypothetical protein